MQLNKKMKILLISATVMVFIVAGSYVALQPTHSESHEQLETAVAESSGDGHDHGGEDEKHKDEAEDLFSEKGDADHDDHIRNGETGDEHAGHGHTEATDTEPDEHAGHGHTEATDTEPDEHAGHGHASGADGICPEHRVPETEDALCQGGHLAELHPGEGMKVRLSSPDVAARAGVGTDNPQTVSFADGIDLPAQVKFNRTNLAHITPLSAGIVLQVYVQPGSRIRKGDPLARIAMPEIASLKAQLITANARENQTAATYQREKNLMERGISSKLEFQQAEAQYRAAQSAAEQYRQHLMNFGLDPATIAQLLIDGESSASLFLRAPLSGTIVAVETGVGEAVEPGTPLFTLADLDSLWVELSVPEARIYKIREKARIQARFNGLPDTIFTGHIFQTGTVVDEQTRTLKVLAEVKNPGQRLKVGMFGSVRLLEGDEEKVLAVSADALQNIDGKAYVFVQLESDLFDLRRVEVGAKTDGMVVVLAGLFRDDQVVTSQGFALKSEVLKARLGASCADH